MFTIFFNSFWCMNIILRFRVLSCPMKIRICVPNTQILTPIRIYIFAVCIDVSDIQNTCRDWVILTKRCEVISGVIRSYWLKVKSCLLNLWIWMADFHIENCVLNILYSAKLCSWPCIHKCLPYKTNSVIWVRKAFECWGNINILLFRFFFSGKVRSSGK